jgi:hypothetical protein
MNSSFFLTNNFFYKGFSLLLLKANTWGTHFRNILLGTPSYKKRKEETAPLDQEFSNQATRTRTT